VSAAPGWYPDPAATHQLRWWTGVSWTTDTHVVSPEPAPPTYPRRTSGDVWLPAQFVEHGYVPPICVRHGKVAERMQPTPVYSRTPLWVIPLALFSLLLGLLLALAMRETVWGRWAVCRVCVHERQQRRQVMWVSLGAAVLAVAGGIALRSGWLALAALPLLVVSLVFRDLGDWRRVTAADADRQTRVIHVKAPSEAFLSALP
jgi:hypothetical protein